MTKRLLWRLCLIVVIGIVAMFYIINVVSLRTESSMSLISKVDRDELEDWGKHAEQYYIAGDAVGLKKWIEQLEYSEQTSVGVVGYEFDHIAGAENFKSRYLGNNVGRDPDWEIHLYFEDSPLMEIPFESGDASFAVVLPDRMRPGDYWPITRIGLHIVIPMSLLVLLTFYLYRHIMIPLRQLQAATLEFSKGNLAARIGESLGNRNDELSELAGSFDNMASRISDQIITQRQLISDLSHELRTPLTRLDIAINQAKTDSSNHLACPNLSRIELESSHIRKLVEDTLVLAWLENERPKLEQETLDLVDLIDVIVEDARFEFPDREIVTQLPSSAELKNSSHRSLGPALENIIRNALRFTPVGQSVEVSLTSLSEKQYGITVSDNGPGVPEHLLDVIFQPFYRIDESRQSDTSSFGLGLALARRLLHAVGGTITASNIANDGLRMTITLPKR